MEITLEGKKSKDRMGLVSRSHVTLASSQWQSRKRELRESCMNRQKMEPAVASRALPQWRKQRDNQNNLCFPCHGFWNVDMQQPEQAALAYAEFLKYKYPMCVAEEWLPETWSVHRCCGLTAKHTVTATGWFTMTSLRLLLGMSLSFSTLQLEDMTDKKIINLIDFEM